MAKGYMVQSEAVKAFMKVFRLRFIIEKKGSFTGYFAEPQSAVCSSMWATPVESRGTVLNSTENAFSESGRLTCICFAPVAS